MRDNKPVDSVVSIVRRTGFEVGSDNKLRVKANWIDSEEEVRRSGLRDGEKRLKISLIEKGRRDAL